MELTSQRLRLRPLTEQDAPAIQRMASDPKIAATTLAVPHPYPDGAAARWIAGHDALLRSGHPVFGIATRDTDELVGTISLRCHPVHLRAELGYWVGVAYWGNGYATEAVRTIVDWGFETFGLERVYAQHLAGNEASGRVMQKAGLRYEGTLRHCVRKNGTHYDTPMYAILRADWENDRAEH